MKAHDRIHGRRREARKRRGARSNLNRLQGEHEKLMDAIPFPHAGWAFCHCEAARKIRGLVGLKPEPPRHRTEDDVHTFFELSYAQYLTIPRSVLQAMPLEWQLRFVFLLRELDETFEWRPREGRYWVQLKDGEGRYVTDPLMQYRRPDIEYIASIRRHPITPQEPTA